MITIKSNLHNKSLNSQQQDTDSADTIYLHKRNNTWVACGDSSLLLKHYLTPVFLRMVTVGGVKTPYAVWNGTSTIQCNSGIEMLQFVSDQSAQMTVRCVFSSADVKENRE